MKRILLMLFAVAFSIQLGCAGTKIITKEVPSSEPVVNTSILTPVPVRIIGQAQVAETYKVVRGDCLWKIAANQYADAFQWPLVFQANRDQIRDPNLIYPKQVFVIARGHSPKAVEDAKKAARKMPKYHRAKKSLNHIIHLNPGGNNVAR